MLDDDGLIITHASLVKMEEGPNGAPGAASSTRDPDQAEVKLEVSDDESSLGAAAADTGGFGANTGGFSIANTTHDVHREEGPPAGGAKPRQLGGAFKASPASWVAPSSPASRLYGLGGSTDGLGRLHEDTRTRR